MLDPVDGRVSATATGDVTTDANDSSSTAESTVYGDVVAQPNTNIDIDGNSSVAGAVVAMDDSLNLDNVTVDGQVYATDGSFTCSGDTTSGPDETSCGEYDPRDPDDS